MSNKDEIYFDGNAALKYIGVIFPWVLPWQDLLAQ